MSKKKKNGARKAGAEVQLDEMNIFLQIPAEAVSLEVIAKIMDTDGKLQQVSTTLSVSEVHKQRQAFLDNVEFGDDYDGKFVITEEGRRYLEELAQKRGDSR